MPYEIIGDKASVQPSVALDRLEYLCYTIVGSSKIADLYAVFAPPNKLTLGKPIHDN